MCQLIWPITNVKQTAYFKWGNIFFQSASNQKNSKFQIHYFISIVFLYEDHRDKKVSSSMTLTTTTTTTTTDKMCLTWSMDCSGRKCSCVSSRNDCTCARSASSRGGSQLCASSWSWRRCRWGCGRGSRRRRWTDTSCQYRCPRTPLTF